VLRSAYERKPVGNQWVNVVDFLGKRSRVWASADVGLLAQRPTAGIMPRFRLVVEVEFR
jgi:hypothetical protein